MKTTLFWRSPKGVFFNFMPSTKKQRVETVATLSQDLDNIQGLVVAGYVGVKTPELNELRGKLRPVKSECRIVKNTLAKIALKNKGLGEFVDFFQGPSALVIQKGDAVASLKVLVEFSKAHEKLQIRGGIMNGHLMKSDDIKALAALPPRNVLIARFMGSLQAPVSRLQGLLSAHLRYLANALDQAAKKKEKAI